MRPGVGRRHRLDWQQLAFEPDIAEHWHSSWALDIARFEGNLAGSFVVDSRFLERCIPVEVDFDFGCCLAWEFILVFLFYHKRAVEERQRQ